MGFVHALMMVVDNADHSVGIRHALVRSYWWVGDDHHLTKIHSLNVMIDLDADAHSLVNDDTHCHYYSDNGCDDDDDEGEEMCFVGVLRLPLDSYYGLMAM